MARRDQYIKSKSDFFLRKKHAVTAIGTIYESDHMTIIPNDGLYDEDRTVYSDSNFKFRVRGDVNGKKKHFSGKWISSDDDVYWTEGDCSAGTTTTETKIRLKPNYSSLKDFAYYGSAGELVKATVRDIILRYPGGICTIGDESLQLVDGKYSVGNFFGIDIWTPASSVPETENPLRVFSVSADKYLCMGKNINSVTIQMADTICFDDIMATTTVSYDGGTLLLYTYYSSDGEYVVLIDGNSLPAGTMLIEPKVDVFLDGYNKLDDFEMVLLPLNTKPFFTAEIDTPYFDGQGYYYTKKKYTWPSLSGNSKTGYPTPMTSGPVFDAYLKDLLAITEFHDEFDSDNIWRMLTHDSIKNLDWTFFRNSVDGDIEDLSEMNHTRIKGAIELYGRQFDDLLRYTNNIKTSNSITYDGKNNTPDYFLTDCVENDGWDAYHIAPTTDESIITDVLYSGVTYSGQTAADSNIEFMRRLVLNSDYIQSLKGTRRGIEVILGLLGFDASGYTIKEHVAVAHTFPDESDFRMVLAYHDDYYYDDDVYAGWPVTVVNPNPSDDESNEYLIPWYDNGLYSDYDFYFQNAGGWEHSSEKSVPFQSGFTTISAITGQYISIYGETLQYMKYASSLSELTELTVDNLFDNCVCYVEDIGGLESMYEADANDKIVLEASGSSVFSHYFVLKNEELSTKIGYVDNDVFTCYGWRNVFTPEFDGTEELTCDGERVLYMESIKTTMDGNNPHGGFGKYDDGESYLDAYNHLFKNDIEHNKFSTLEDDDEIVEKARNMGFNAEMVEVNKKCYYFKDSDLQSCLRPEGEVDADANTSNWDDFYKELVSPEPEYTEYDEPAALSIINDKNITIDFSISGNTYLKQYIEDVVLRYVEQMMPSTAIFTYTFDGAMPSAVADLAPDSPTVDSVSVFADTAIADGDDSGSMMLGYDIMNNIYDPEIV